MKIICNKQDIAVAVSTVAEAISRNPEKPIISGIYMETENNKLTLKATDTYTSLIMQIPAKVETPGKTVLPGAALSSLLRDLPVNEVSISQQSNLCEIIYGKNKATLNTMEAEQFPSIDIPEGEAILVNKDLFQHALEKIVPTINTNNEQRPQLTGIHFDFNHEENCCYLVGTDLHRLSCLQYKMNSHTSSFNVMVPTIKVAAKIFKGEEPIKMWPTKNLIAFSDGTTTVIGRLIGQQYVAYTQVIPKNKKTTLKYTNSELREAVERAYALKAGLLKLTFAAQTCNITAENEVGTVNETVAITGYEEEPLELYVDTRYLKDALRSIERTQHKEVSLQLNGSKGQLFFNCEEYIHILLPRSN